MNENIEILLSYMNDKENCVKSLVLGLASSVLSMKHDCNSCSCFRGKIETLGMIMKVQSSFKKSKIQENSPVIEKVLNMCVDLLFDLTDGKDLCIPIICDVLCTSLALLPKCQTNEKIKFIVYKCKSQLIKFVDNPQTREDLSNTSVEITKLGISLRVWESIIPFMTVRKEKSDGLENMDLSHIRNLFDDEFIELLLKIIGLEHNVLTSQALLCFIPKLVKLTESNVVLVRLWQGIRDKFSSVNNSPKVTPQMFLVLCALSDYFIPHGYDVPYVFPIEQFHDFWLILQLGFVSNDSLVRKQALYLLKRAVKRESILAMPISQESEMNFWWNKDISQQYLKVWNELFLLHEVLEEKQIHLIEPIQPIIKSVINACKMSLIHSSWILCIIQRALEHENNAVVKWGILCFTELDINIYMKANTDISLILLSLLNALNSSSLFSKSNSELLVPEIAQGLRSFFEAVAEEHFDICQDFFRSLLKTIVQISWGPVALFYITYALALVPKCPIMVKSDILALKSFLVGALTTQIVHIRGAIQAFFIDVLINLADEQQFEVNTIADIMGTFKQSECLRRGTQTWNTVTLWLKTFVKEKDAFTFTQESLIAVVNHELKCEKLATARMMILLSDAELICLDMSNTCHLFSLHTTLLSLTEYFENCHERVYACQGKQNSCLEMLIHVLEECQPIVENDRTGKCVLSLISTIIPGFLNCVMRSLYSAYNLECFDTIHLYLHSLNILAKEPKLISDLLKHAGVLQEASIFIMNSENENASPMSKYFSIKILTWISSLIMNSNFPSISSSELYRKQMSFSQSILHRKNLNKVLIKGEQDKQLTRDLQTLWGKLVSEHMHSTWCLIHFFIEIQSNTSLLKVDSQFAQHLLKEAIEALEVGGRGMLIPVMSVMQHILDLLVINDSKEEVKRFISVCWADIFELRKSDLFWISMEKFIKMSFQKCLMNNEDMNGTLLFYAKEIFSQGETMTSLCNLLLKHLQEVAKNFDLSRFEPFSEILINALVFGPVHRRDRKIDDETCAFIRSLGDKCCINYVSEICSDAEVRARGIELLLSFEENVTSKDTNMFVKLAGILLERDLQVSQLKTRYFANSYHHRHRNRIMQVFLVLEPFLHEEQCDRFTTYLCRSLLSENHQPSIRYLQEWLLIRLLYRNHKAHCQIWSVLQAASETKPGSLCSFISIIYHIARILPRNEGLENFIDKGMNEILPCTMIQHFNVRLYAQVSFFKLWEYACENDLVNVTEKYHTVYLCIMTNLHSPNSIKSVKKLDDFYFTVFHPLEHYSLQTIFSELPRLTNVTQDEWISCELLLTCGVKTKNVLLMNKNSDLLYCKQLTSTVKSGLLYDEKDTLSSEVGNVQKKIIPWKAMVPDPEMLLSLSESVLQRKQTIRNDGLIVVASLIDRTPNLGGLSRTCEAFGVSQYVLGNMKYIEDREFQILSVSAERWIPIMEVKPNELAVYLEDAKHRGYTIVGAEQTAYSVLLNEVKFPKRTLLLLGNEKEGIPVNLLPMLDMCVEVPQQGVIRSLNVHVTGAIFIWEYARQHNVRQTVKVL